MERSFGARAQIGQGGDHLGDHVPGPLDHDHIALTEVFAPDIFLVVQGGLLHRDPAHLDRLQFRPGVEHAGPAHVDVDRDQPGLGGGGRELVGHSPARVASDGSKSRLQATVVQLHHHPVDVVVEVAPAILPLPARRDDLVHIRRHPDVGVDPEPGRAQPGEDVVVARELHPFEISDAVEPGREWTRSRHPGVELAQRSRRRVAGIGEGGFPRRHPLLVQVGKRFQGQVHLTPDLHGGRVRRDRGQHGQGYGRDGT